MMGAGAGFGGMGGMNQYSTNVNYGAGGAGAFGTKPPGVVFNSAMPSGPGPSVESF
jgi:hypothetical protein